MREPTVQRSYTYTTLQVDLAPIIAEVAQVKIQDWLAHAPEPLGDTSLPLIAVGGTPNLDYAIAGPMQPTAWLDRSPALRRLLQSVDAPLSRCRLMRLPAQTALPAAADHSYHMFRRRTTLVPLVTDSVATFYHYQADQPQELALQPGQPLTFDHTYPYCLVNESNDGLIHLVIESRSMAFSASPAFASQLQPAAALALEAYQFEVLTPAEMTALLTGLVDALTATAIAPMELDTLRERVQLLQHRWEQLFARFGHQATGELAYQDLLLQIEGQFAAPVQQWLSHRDRAGWRAFGVIRSMLWTAPRPPAAAPNLAPAQSVVAPRKDPSAMGEEQRMLSSQISLRKNNVATITPPVFTQPLFIVSAPRSGSTLLFETLSQFPAIWSIGIESHELIEGIPALHPAAHGYRSNRLTADDVTPAISAALHKRFAHRLQDRTGVAWRTLSPPEQPAAVRLLEKTPKNALRIPFLKAVFPDARFLFLYREPLANISSMMEGWRLQRFQPGYRLPGWPYEQVAWSFLLAPGWETLAQRPVAEIAAYQWRVANETILDDLATLAPHEWQLIHYDDLVRQPQATIRRLAAFADLAWDAHIEAMVAQPLPVSSKTLSAPGADKWRKHAWLLTPMLPMITPVMERIAQMTERKT